MKRISKMFFIVLLSFSLFGLWGGFTGNLTAEKAIAAEAKGDKELKSDTYNGVTFSYPAGWEVKDNDEGTIRYYYADGQNFMMVQVTSLGNYNTDGISDEDLTTIMNSFIEGVESSGGVIDGDTELKETAGSKGFHFIFTEDINGTTYACDTYDFLKGTNLYNFSFAYPKDEGNKYAADFESILKSIKVE